VVYVRPEMRARWWSLAALLAALTALAVWRAACVRAGPDIDTDAYAHHAIARQIAADPRDLGAHWVWLPLFHFAQLPLVLAGGTMEHVRWANVALTALLPIVLFAYVRRTARPGAAGVPADVTALVAALVAAACPVAMQMGTTAQPEPLFALLALGVAISFERRRDVAAAVMLGTAVLLRYEAWAVVAAAAAALAVERARARGGRAGVAAVGGGRAWVVVAVPVALILGWAALRRPVDGQWFGFLRQTHEFATGALPGAAAADHGFGQRALWLARDLLFYPVFVAARALGPALAFVPFGVARTVREQGGRFTLVLLACLGFVSLSWATRSSLGLDRHFVAVVPLYATFAAQGLSAAADARARAAGRAAGEARERSAVVTSIAAGRTVGAALAFAVIAGLGVELVVWMGSWRASIARGWPDRSALGAYLRSLPGTPTVFCDDATLEILSGLDRRRFDRHWVDDPHTWALVEEAARERGTVYVATWRRKLRGHEPPGRLVFEAGGDPADAEGSGVAVLRVAADESRSQR